MIYTDTKGGGESLRTKRMRERVVLAKREVGNRGRLEASELCTAVRLVVSRVCLCLCAAPSLFAVVGRPPCPLVLRVSPRDPGASGETGRLA